MSELFELKKQLVLGQEALDRTKEQLQQLQQELNREREQRLTDEERSRSSKLENEILQKIGEICSPGAEHHLLTLLKSGGFLEIEGDRVSIKSTNQYGLPATLPLELGLEKTIKSEFPHFLGSQQVTSKDAPSSSGEKLETMSDQQLLSLMKKPEEMTKIVNSL